MATKFWVRTNESSKAPAIRKRHVEKNGGKFIRCATGWEWIPGVMTETMKPTPKKTKKSIFKD